MKKKLNNFIHAIYFPMKNKLISGIIVYCRRLTSLRNDSRRRYREGITCIDAHEQQLTNLISSISSLQSQFISNLELTDEFAS